MIERGNANICEILTKNNNKKKCFGTVWFYLVFIWMTRLNEVIKCFIWSKTTNDKVNLLTRQYRISGCDCCVAVATQGGSQVVPAHTEPRRWFKKVGGEKSKFIKKLH